MPQRFNPQNIPSSRRISMERAFTNGNHKNISAVALHVGVNRKVASAYLKHLIAVGQLPKDNRFVKSSKRKYRENRNSI